MNGNSPQEFDGDGRRVKNNEAAAGNITLYYLWSSVLGQVVADLTPSYYTTYGLPYRAYVYSPSGALLAQQGYDTGFTWVHTDHLGSGYKLSNTSGNVYFREEYDPHGQTLLRISSNGPWYLSKKFTGYERDYGTNTNYAKARQYQHNNARFLQADPLGLGASDLSDPQSLNLYSYVQNDPVNFTDPSGLDSGYCDATGCTIIGTIGGSVLPLAIGGDQMFMIEDGPVDAGGGGGGGEVQQTPTQAPPNDCQRFADIVQQTASQSSGHEDFMNRMARTFTAANNSTIGEMREAAYRRAPADRVILTDRGFKGEFRDGGNQARHFVGGLVAGYRLGSVAGLAFMDPREIGDSMADVRLNHVSVNLGAGEVIPRKSRPTAVLTVNPGTNGYVDLAEKIRSTICE